MNSTSKKMLYISIRNKDNIPYMLFEIENYFRDKHRRVYTEQSFKALTLEAVSNDFEALDSLGFKILIGLLSKNALKNHSAIAVYESRHTERSALALDEEEYRLNPERKFCEEIPLALDLDANKFDDVMCMRVAHKILKYLPLPE